MPAEGGASKPRRCPGGRFVVGRCYPPTSRTTRFPESAMRAPELAAATAKGEASRACRPGAPLPEVALLAVAGDGVDVAGGHRLPVTGPGRSGDHAHPVVAGVGDEDVPGGSTATPSGLPGRPRSPGRRPRRNRRRRCRRWCRCRRRSLAARSSCRCVRPPRRICSLRVSAIRTFPAASSATPSGSAGGGRRAAVPGETGEAVAGDGVDVAGGHRLPVVAAGVFGHHPDPVVLGVGDDQVPGRVDLDASRPVQGGCGRRAAVPGEPLLAVPAMV